MSMTLLLILGGALLFTAVMSAGFAFASRRPNIDERVTGIVKEKQRFDLRRYIKRSEKVLKPIGSMIPRSLDEMSRQEKRLAQAGIRRKDGPALLYGVKFVLAALLLFAGSLVPALRANPILMILLPVLLGMLIPDMWVSRMVQRRKESLQRALPDALDLAVVCVEAGLGLDQSLLRIGTELTAVYPELSDELQLYSLEVNAGKKRSDALRNLGTRTDVDDLKSFTAVLIQTDRFGTSVAQSLRVFAETMRTKRRQRAEEHAAKMAIKMIPPLVFFIFPAIFIVTIGPAVIRIAKYLVPGLK